MDYKLLQEIKVKGFILRLVDFYLIKLHLKDIYQLGLPDTRGGLIVNITSF